uniref:Uncharacterized protein n=1 Tax=Anguilla anguilla TaxID=7936 RepID=A0A0E9Q4H7_ANGAN
MLDGGTVILSSTWVRLRSYTFPPSPLTTLQTFPLILDATGELTKPRGNLDDRLSSFHVLAV